jgi:hypothetical protein
MHSSNKIIFVAELIGTFVLVVGATGSIVYNEMLGGIYGIGFIAAGHLAALSIAVYMFGKYSLLDVFVVVLASSYIQYNNMVNIQPGEAFLPFMLLQISDEDLKKLERDFPKDGDRILLLMLTHPKEEWEKLGIPPYLRKYELVDEDEEDF